jgi:hypothetical protein
MNAETFRLIQLQNARSVIVIDPFGGAITDFHLKDINVNPLSFCFTKEQMPENNKGGAPYKGHFLCLGRWGEPSVGEINSGLPNHGQFANILWVIEKNKERNIVKMDATADLEGLHIKRKVILDIQAPVFVVNEVVRNINPLGRLYNMVQHPSLAAPFLEETTVVDCNGSVGFDQAFYKETTQNTLQWPAGKDGKQNDIDLRKSVTPYNSVFSFVVKKDDEYGWITAYSGKHHLLFGYTWERSDYPWIHLWQYYNQGIIQYRGIEFGTAGIHQPFNEILNTSPILFGEKTYAFIDAGESISKNYFSFLYETKPGFEGVKDVKIANDQIRIKGKNGEKINLTISTNLINELSK